MRVLITGSRDWDDYERIENVLTTLASVNDNVVVVEGACPTGADYMAHKVAIEHGLGTERYPADWSKGRGAGPIRNQQMVDTKPDACYAFIKNNSRGATHCANAAKKAGISTIIFEIKESV